MQRRLSQILALIAVPLMLMTLAMPSEFLASLFGATVAVVSSLIVWRAAAHHRPRWTISWNLIAIGLCCGALSQILNTGDPSTARVVATGLSGTIALLSSAMGVVLWMRAGWAGWRTSALVDAGIISAATGVVLWHAVLQPAGLTGGAMVIALSSTGTVVVASGVIIRLLEGRQFYPSAGYFLLASFFQLMAIPVEFAFDIDPLRIGASGLASLAFVAAAAAHPSMRLFTEQLETHGQLIMGRYRFAILCSVLLVGPALHFKNGSWADQIEAVVMSAIVIVVMLRMSSLIKEREHAQGFIEASIDRTRAVVELSKDVLRAEALHHAMNEVIAMVKRQLPDAIVVLWTVDQNDRLVMSNSDGVDMAIHATELPLDEMTAEGQAVLGGATAVVSHRLENLEYSEIPAVDALCVPMSGRAGVLAVYFTQHREILADEILMLEQVATVVGMAVERAEVERDDRQAQKLEAVGRLAAGIAHEINTPVQFVGDNLHFLKDAFSELLQVINGEADPASVDVAYLSEEVPLSITQAQDGVTRVATIVKAMKAFGHPDQQDQSYADLNVALENTLIVARNEIKYVAEVEARLGKLPPVLCHVGDLNQVFLNLLVNAAHAIADKHGPDGRGRIAVRTWCDKESVYVAIGDDGGGVPKELHNKIWEPFFTTKGVGRGTGQGLSLARAVVERHQGKIRLSSDADGSVFCIQLPIAGATDTEPPAQAISGDVVPEEKVVTA